MDKIFIINHSSKNCGVYQYGKRLFNIVSKSKNNDFLYFEINNLNELIYQINFHDPKIIIYNYISLTMPWLNHDVVAQIRTKGIKQGTIVHNDVYGFFDFNLHQNPDFVEFKDNYNLPRPLFDYNKTELSNDFSKIKIGSFGFGFKCKSYDKICEMINNQFSNEDNVEINLHLTYSFFGKNGKDIEDIIKDCNDKITKKNIILNFTTDFISDENLLDFLSKNDLNIFFYEKFDFYNGISSVIDYALSVKKPIAICKSNMFSHIYDSKPSICVEDLSLKEIINNGTDPLLPYFRMWSNEKLSNKLDYILRKTYE